MRKILSAAPVAVLLLTLGACTTSASPDNDDAVEDPAPAATAEEAATQEPKVVEEEPEKPSPEPPADVVEVTESGVGKGERQYGWASALVRNVGHAGGFVTVHFNVYDEADELIASGEQIETIATDEGLTAVGTQIDLGEGNTPARVETTVEVSDSWSEPETKLAIEPVEAIPGEYGSLELRVENPTDENWDSLRVGIICRDTDGDIVGGGHAYPQLVPAGSESIVDGSGIFDDSVDACTAYPYLSDY